MNRITVILLLLVVVTGAFTATAQAPAEKRPTVLAALKEGQSVFLKEVSGRYEIRTLENAPVVQSHKVIEVGVDFLVIQDISGITETRIPIWSIQAIVRVTLPKK